MGDSTSDNRAEPVTFASGDRRLAGTLFHPAVPPAAVVVIHCATGVPQGYYRHFAAWVADRFSAVVLTYDYRDFGQSGTGRMRASTATMVDWGVHDQSAALDYLVGRYPDLPVDVIGHSLGGQTVPFHAQGRRVRRLIAVASGLPFWRKHPARYMPQVIAFWFLFGPLLVAMLGYLPGKVAGLGADLPSGVYWQWRRWCTRHDYFLNDPKTPLPEMARVTAQVSLVALADDVMVPPHRVEALRRVYPAADVQFDVLSPGDLGVSSIGHIPPFSKKMQGVWPALVQRWA